MHISAAEAHHQQVLEIARGEAAQRQLAEERARNREHQVEHLQIRMRKLNEDNEKALAFYKEQASELSREQKQKFINDMNEDHQMELEALRKEMQQAQEEKDQAETLEEKMSFQLHDAKRALNKVEEKLLKQECLMPKLVEINTASGPLSKPAPDQPRHYIREFGVLQPHEAYELGIDPLQCFEWLQWTAYDEADSRSILVQNALNPEEGKYPGFRRESWTEKVRTHDRSAEHGFRYIQVTQEPTLYKEVKQLVAKLRLGKAKIEKIMEKLLSVLNEYAEHPGTGYSVSKRLWHREKNRELNWEEKMDLFFEIGCPH